MHDMLIINKNSLRFPTETAVSAACDPRLERERQPIVGALAIGLYDATARISGISGLIDIRRKRGFRAVSVEVALREIER